MLGNPQLAVGDLDQQRRPGGVQDCTSLLKRLLLEEIERNLSNQKGVGHDVLCKWLTSILYFFSICSRRVSVSKCFVNTNSILKQRSNSLFRY